MRRATILLALAAALAAAGCAAPQESGEADTCPSSNESSAYYRAGTNDSCPEEALEGSGRETAEDDAPVPYG